MSNNDTTTFHLTNSDIKFIMDALHRDAQRCDDVVEDQLIAGNLTNIKFYTDKAAALRELAYDLTNGNCMPAIEVPNHLPKKFDPTAVKVLTPNNPVSNSMPPLIAKLIMPANLKRNC